MHPQIIALFPGLCMGLGTRLPTNHSIEMRMPMWSVTSYPDSFSWRKEGAWVQSYSGLNMSLYTQTTALFPDPLKFPHNLVMEKDWEWGYLASNPGFPFRILSCSFGEKSDFSPKLGSRLEATQISTLYFYLSSSEFSAQLSQAPLVYVRRSLRDAGFHRILVTEVHVETHEALFLCHDTPVLLVENITQDMYIDLDQVCRTVASFPGCHAHRYESLGMKLVRLM